MPLQMNTNSQENLKNTTICFIKGKFNDYFSLNQIIMISVIMKLLWFQIVIYFMNSVSMSWGSWAETNIHVIRILAFCEK